MGSILLAGGLRSKLCQKKRSEWLSNKNPPGGGSSVVTVAPPLQVQLLVFRGTTSSRRASAGLLGLLPLPGCVTCVRRRTVPAPHDGYRRVIIRIHQQQNEPLP